MTSSTIASSSAAQWLHGLLAKGAPSQTGHPSKSAPTDSPAPLEDTASISKKAFQLNQAAGVSTSFDKDDARDVHRVMTTQASLVLLSSLIAPSGAQRDVSVQPLGSHISLVC